MWLSDNQFHFPLIICKLLVIRGGAAVHWDFHSHISTFAMYCGKSKKLFWVRQELTRGSNVVGSLPQMTLINCLFASSIFGQCGLWIFHWSHGRSWKFYEVKSSQECLCVAIYANPWPRTFLVTNINNQIKQSNQITSKPIDSVTVFSTPFLCGVGQTEGQC